MNVSSLSKQQVFSKVLSHNQYAKNDLYEKNCIMKKCEAIKNKRKEYLKILEKYYIVDIGMRYMLLGTQKIDAGHILENVVYLELLRRGNKVFVGKVDHFEVDFVAQNSKGIEYYQVALTVRDEKTLQEQSRHLQAIQELP